jgi:hypothetical protein
MNKINLLQIMNLANKLEHTEWISILLRLNNDGHIEQFLNMINQSKLLNEVLQETKKTNLR